MAKKNFKEDPAEMFVTKDSSEEEGKTTPEKKVIENKVKKPEKKDAAAESEIGSPENRSLSSQLPLFEGMPLTLEEAKNSGQVQTKNRRVNLLMQPTVYNKAETAAKNRGMSLNAYMSYLVKNADD